MTWREMAAWAVERLACPYCGVAAGEPCRSKGGVAQSVDRTHWNRVMPIHKVWQSAFRMGREDTLRTVAAQGQSWALRQLERIDNS